MPTRPPPHSLFPYTTLFRSAGDLDQQAAGGVHRRAGDRGAGGDLHRNGLTGEHRFVNGGGTFGDHAVDRSEEHTSELQSRGHLVCRLLLEKKNDKRVSFTIY